MRYRLCERYRLEGWKGRLTGVFDTLRGETFFLPDGAYRLLMRMDGLREFQEEQMTPAERELILRFQKEGLIRACPRPEPLEAEQKYRYYDNPYVAYAHWAITGKCNYRCRHCYMYAPQARFPEPDMETCRTMIRQMSRVGIHAVGLTGGEPLVRGDFLKLVDELADGGIRVHSIYTNGARVTDGLLKELEKRGQKPRFHISYDGESYHDWLRGIPGARESALRAMEVCRKHGNELYAAMCVHRKNRHEIFETVRFLASRGVSRTRVKFMLPNGLWADENASGSLDVAEATDAVIEFIEAFFAAGMPSDVVIDNMFQYEREGRFCTVPYARKCQGDEYLCRKTTVTPYIGPTGVVLPCMTLGGCAFQDRFPNALETPLQQILSGSYYSDVIHTTKQAFFDSHEECGDCPEREVCTTGCRACATEDYLAPDRWNCAFLRGGHYRRVDEAIRSAIAKYCPNEEVQYRCFTD